MAQSRTRRLGVWATLPATVLSVAGAVRWRDLLCTRVRATTWLIAAPVIANGAVVPLVELLKRDGPPALLVTLGFSICNLIRAGGALAEFVNRGIIALVLRLLTPVQHVEVVAEMAWLLTYIAAGDDAYKAAIVSMGGLELCVQLCASPVTSANPAVMIPLMRALGNLCSAPDPIIVRMLANRGFLQALWSRLAVPDNNLLREVCWALNNLSGGPPEASAALVQVRARVCACAMATHCLTRVAAQLCSASRGAPQWRRHVGAQGGWICVPQYGVGAARRDSYLAAARRHAG